MTEMTTPKFDRVVLVIELAADEEGYQERLTTTMDIIRERHAGKFLSGWIGHSDRADAVLAVTNTPSPLNQGDQTP